MIRKVSLNDAKAISDIYNHYVLNTVITFDLDSISEQEMQSMISHLYNDYPFFVYEIEGEVAGYSYVHQWRPKVALKRTVEVTVYVAPKYIGNGIGTMLMRRLIDCCRDAGFHSLISGIVDGNDVSFKGSSAISGGIIFRQKYF